MRTIVYGPGAIGGTVAGHLALAGYDVALIGRGAHLEAIRHEGLRFVTPGPTHVLRLPAVSTPGELAARPDDVVLLCVKGQHTNEALAAFQAAMTDVPVFCLQNGVGNEEIAARYFPRVYGVVVRVGGVHLVPGEVKVRRDPPGMLVIGRYPRGLDDTAHAVASQLRAAGFAVFLTDDIMPYKWGKLLENVTNAVGAIVDEGEDDAVSARICGAVEREARELMARAGIRWVLPTDLMRQHPELDPPLRGSIANVEMGSSTWQSLARGQGSAEGDMLNGEIVRLAARLGAEAPLSAGLVRILSGMAARHEPPGKYTPAQLSAELGLG